LKNRLARIQATERFVPLTIGYANIYIYVCAFSHFFGNMPWDLHWEVSTRYELFERHLTMGGE